MTRITKTPRQKPAAKTPEIDNRGTTQLEGPVFAQPEPTPDPTKFEIKHPSDNPAYKQIDELNREHKIAPLPFPEPRGLPEPKLTLAEVLATTANALQQKVEGDGQIVFHATGDTGSTRGPESQNLVSDKMVNDFTDVEKERPLFFLHLGDVIYSFGEAQYYYDQFYEPYRDYPAPIVALAGNHDGMVAPGTSAVTLAAFLENFCAEKFEVTSEAGGLARTAQVQPGVFFTFEAPLLRILVLYSNTLEDPGVIASPAIGTSPISKPPSSASSPTNSKERSFSPITILPTPPVASMAGARRCSRRSTTSARRPGVWPHAVLSAHAHNYQRFTRLHGETQIPYVTCGNGGHGLTKLSRKNAPALRTPQQLQITGHGDKVILENYDDQDYGYLRIVVTTKQLRVEYHPASDGEGAKTPDDFVTVDLATRKLVHFTGA